MKKSILCGLILAVAANVLSAGDVATFVDKGFSQDGKYYVFGQYGKTDKKFQGWAEIFQVDITANDYVDSGIFKTSPSAATADKNGREVFESLEAKNSSYIERLNCKKANLDHVLYILDDVNKAGTDEIVFKDFRNSGVQDTYKIKLIPTISGKGKTAKSSFYIDLKKYDAEGNLIEKKIVGSPDINRKGVTNYKIERIFCDEAENCLIFIVEKHFEDEAGLSIRYMVEAIRF